MSSRSIAVVAFLLPRLDNSPCLTSGAMLSAVILLRQEFRMSILPRLQAQMGPLPTLRIEKGRQSTTPTTPVVLAKLWSSTTL